jgi:hypothetical protein
MLVFKPRNLKKYYIFIEYVESFSSFFVNKFDNVISIFRNLDMDFHFKIQIRLTSILCLHGLSNDPIQ